MIDVAELARSYDPPGYVDTADLLEDYQAFLEYSAAHPSHGRGRIANALEVPEGRVRGWKDGSVPDAVRGVQVAEKHGWLDATPDDEIGRALCVALMGIIACGAVDMNRFMPSWTPSTDEGTARLRQAVNQLGLDTRQSHAGDDKPTELLPTDGATVLGRVLVVLGAPRGDKNRRTMSTVPDVIQEAGALTRAACVELYVLERGTFYDEKDTISLQLQDRPDRFKESLASLIRSVIDGEVSSGATVQISAKATRDLGFDRDGALRPK